MNDHGPDGLYDKFIVRRAKTGALIGRDGEFIFVLRPERDESAKDALITYAAKCEQRGYPNLAREIRMRLR